ncbi:MAG: Flp pilus assembly protein CpaB [Elusimicrobia bacterium]|nr:Flp pilus assembly protein CpaB [Elusimicrobiota bacterium]
MEKKSVLIPMALALLAAVLFFAILTSKERQLTREFQMAKVLAAAADLPERTVLNDAMVEEIEVPRKFMQQDAFEVRTPGDRKAILNLVTRTRVPKGNQLTQSALVPQSPESGLSVKVPPGYRGAILEIPPELKALIKPGDHVDVLVSFEALMNDGRKERVTATILQNIPVIAVGTNLGQGLSAKQFKQFTEREDRTAAFSEKATVSLALNPTEAQYLALAVRQGETAVVLRGLGDVEMHPMEMASFRKLFRN